MSPDRDPQAWSGLIESLGVESILVVISTWMGPRLRQETSAEDIWQETLFMAWRDRDQHDWIDVYTYRQWLLGIARNRVRDAVTIMTAKKRGGSRATPVLSSLGLAADGSDSVVPPILPVCTTTPSRVARGRERLEAMEDALRALPEEMRAAVQLRLFEQLPMAEVARELGVTLAIAKKRVYLGSDIYRTRLGELLRMPGSRATEELHREPSS